ncbi:uncharacterized protein IUM83_07938 [Phytophthora cinnamomi]|uniref:uncharacterized protein n=1 Tax=Phytophthora cinnamomi TaxID=4785 RepID=UPI003559E84F|nr:hypothetical protein IUM83_07938 [Phytophthora cinnamomi]
MCDVLQQLQPAGAFLRQAQTLQPAGAFLRHSDPIAVVGSCTDIDEALRLGVQEDGDEDTVRQMESCHQQEGAADEPVDFLASIRRGLDELVAASEADDEAEDSDDDDDEDGDDEGGYYQASKDHTYYSPGQKLPAAFLLDDALDLSDTSTASSLLAAWAQPESEDESDDDGDAQDQEDLIFQLEL